MTRAEAVQKIEALLIRYNKGWTPNWNSCSLKLCIARNRDEVIYINSHHDYHLLAFNSWTTRNKFRMEQSTLVDIYLGINH